MTSIIKVNTIQDVGGNNLLISNGSGTITTNNIGGENTPAFYGELASDQVLSRATQTKVTGMTNDEIDTDSAFDGTTFTVPSGKAGKYFIFANIFANFSDCGNDGEKIQIEIFKNGSSVRESTYNSAANNQIVTFGISVNAMLDLSVGDTIEMYALIQDASANTGMKLGSGGQATHLGGYKLIGV